MKEEPGREKKSQLSPGLWAEASWLGTWVETLNWSSSPTVLCGRISCRLINSLIIYYSACACRGVTGRTVVKSDYKMQDKSRSSVRTVEVSAVMHKVLWLWSGFMLNVLSFKGSEKLNTFHHKGVAKPFLLRLPLFSKGCSMRVLGLLGRQRLCREICALEARNGFYCLQRGISPEQPWQRGLLHGSPGSGRWSSRGGRARCCLARRSATLLSLLLH